MKDDIKDAEAFWCLRRERESKGYSDDQTER